MTKPHIPIIEIMVTDACNFVCDGCTNYSNYKVSGLADWDKVKSQLVAWGERVTFDTVSFIGGEPLLHPGIREFITGTRKIFPHCFIQLTSNAYLLEKNFDILDVMDSVNGALLKVSAHKPNDQWFINIRDQIKNHFKWTHIPDSNWQQNENYMYLEYQYDENFYQTYKGTLATMKPYDNDPAQAFKEMCCQKLCPMMKDGKLFKCSSIAELRRVLTDWNHLDEPEWQKYLEYNGLDISCTDEDLLEWTDNYGKYDWHCGMCPIADDHPEVPHIGHVEFKKDKKIIPIISR